MQLDPANQETWDQLVSWLASEGAGIDRVLLTGSRTWRHPLIRPVLQLLPTTATLVHGGAKGADTLAHQVWTWLGQRAEVHEPHYDYPGDRGAPLRRDQHMVNLGGDCCLGFNRGGSRGTARTCAMAVAGGWPTFIFRTD